jgi:hypothetical protein
MSQKLVDIKSYDFNITDYNKKNKENKNIIDDKNRSLEHAKWFTHSVQDSLFFDALRENLNNILIAKGGQAHQHQLLENPFKDLAPFTMENKTLLANIGLN